jgi:polar amino acid transport system substrate-binding protein
MRKAISSVFLATLLVSVSAIAADPLVVGMELGYPPFEMTDKTNQPEGVSVDLARALAAKLNRPLQIENIPYDGLIAALKTGKIDLIISSMTATPEREKSIDFSKPYANTGLALLLTRNVQAKTFSDLDKEGNVIAVKKGTTGHQYATKQLKKAKILVLDKESAAVLEVLQGKAQAFVYDQLSIYRHWKRNAAMTHALLKPFQQESWAIGVRKGRGDLKSAVDSYLADAKSKGDFKKLGDRWLAEEKAAFAELKVPFIF